MLGAASEWVEHAKVGDCWWWRFLHIGRLESERMRSCDSETLTTKQKKTPSAGARGPSTRFTKVKREQFE